MLNNNLVLIQIYIFRQSWRDEVCKADNNNKEQQEIETEIKRCQSNNYHKDNPNNNNNVIILMILLIQHKGNNACGNNAKQSKQLKNANLQLRAQSCCKI